MAEHVYNSDTEYHADLDRLSATMLRTFVRSVPEYVAKFVERTMPTASTARMDLGTAAHAAILQPDRFEDHVAIAPDCDRRTKAGKDRFAEFEQQAAGKLVVTADAGAAALAMAASVRRVPLAKFLLDATGVVERPVLWTDEASGIDCRCKPDLLLTKAATLVEIKTVSDPSPFAFSRSIHNLGYHLQAVHYMSGTGATRFVWITAHVNAPHEVSLFELDEQSLESAWAQYRSVLSEIAAYKQAGGWPIVPESICKVSLPPWAMRETSRS
jgi:hypothetical protein